MRNQLTSDSTPIRSAVEPVPGAKSFADIGVILSPQVYSRRKWSRPPDFQQALLEYDAAAPLAERSAACGSEHRTAKRCGSPLYLSNGNCCGEGEVRVVDVGDVAYHTLRLRPCRCRKWFCVDCAPNMGWALRRKLTERLNLFRRVYGITLTLDGLLFNSPEAAYRYVRENRCLALLVKELHARGHLHTRAYFWVIEFQEETQQAHWHLLVDASFIPFGEIVEIWSTFRPKSAPAMPEKVTAANYKGLPPAFGSVRFTLQKSTPTTAAKYATKYLVKVPSYGFPDWVLDFVGRIPRHGGSKGFLTTDLEPEDKSSCLSRAKVEESSAVHDEDCFCEVCRGEEAARKPRREFRTLRERIAQCKSSSTFVRVPSIFDDNMQVVDGKPAFMGKLEVPFADACLALGIPPGEVHELYLTDSQSAILLELERELLASREENWSQEDEF
jgi:hypothetical protein